MDRRSRDWATVVRHLWLDEHDARRLVGTGALARLAQEVRESEAHHAGEIRVCIEAALPLTRLLRGCSPRQRAIELYSHLGVGRTTGRNGVLVYLLLADQAVEVVVDPALARADWQPVVAAVRTHFQAQHPAQGLSEAIALVDRRLRDLAPPTGAAANPNELPDDPVVM